MGALAKALGLFSLALGAAQVVAPDAVLRFIGLRGGGIGRLVMRLVGVRELSVVGPLLAGHDQRPWLAARVAGDVMDIGLLGFAMTAKRADRGRLGMALGAVLGVTALDLLGIVRGGDTEDGTERVIKAITVNRPPDDVYRYWRRLENLPRFMAHLETVEETGGRSHWVAIGPGGARVEWDAELTEDQPGSVIAWRSLPDAVVENEGRVRFLPVLDGRATEVHVEMSYRPPAGGLGVIVAQLFRQEPSQQVDDDLRRFKQVMEIGEVVRSDATDARRRLAQRPAQPLGAQS